MSDNHQASRPKRLGFIMLLAAWLLGLGLLSALMNGWLEASHNPNRDVVSSTNDNGEREVVLRQNRGGHYLVNGTIDSVPVTFLLDTGATAVALPQSVADALSLRTLGQVKLRTANGTVTGWRTRLGKVQIGDISLSNVRAHVSPHMQGEEVLLGMSFLRELELTQRNGILKIRQHSP